MSCENEYTGLPSTVTCFVLSGRRTSASDPTPAPAVGCDPASSGSQNDTHPPTQRILPPASCSGVYSACPLASTSTSPTPATCLTETVLPGADAALPVSLLLPQAANTSAPARAAAARRRCMGRLL